VSKKYRKPPIVEVLCELQFEQDSPWDLATTGIIYDKIQKDFPIRRQALRVTLGPPVPGDVNPQIGSVPIMQFWNQDEKALIQVGAYLLSINQLKPYISWEEFLPKVEEGINAYRSVAAPSNIRGISLRYINSINIISTDDVINLDDYLEFRPHVGPNLPQLNGPFTVATQISYENSRDTLTLQLISITGTSTPNTLTVNLDLNYSLAKAGEVALDNVTKWLEEAHQHIIEVFEASITDNVKQEFEEVQE